MDILCAKEINISFWAMSIDSNKEKKCLNSVIRKLYYEETETESYVNQYCTIQNLNIYDIKLQTLANEKSQNRVKKLHARVQHIIRVHVNKLTV